MWTVSILDSLTYTDVAKAEVKSYMNSLKTNFEGLCELVNKEELTIDEALWVQAYEGFLFLSDMPYDFADKIRRYVFKKVLNGKEVEGGKFEIGEGDRRKTYSELTDSELIEIMVAKVQELYRKTGLAVPSTPVLTGYFTGRVKIKRFSLIKLAFALGMSFDDFQNFLKYSAFMRQLSTAVPRELILMYCLMNGKNWQKYLDLLTYAGHRLQYHLNNPQGKVNHVPYTHTDIKTADLLDNAKNRKLSDDLREENFKKAFLEECCANAARKTERGVTYSKTAWEIVKTFSISEQIEKKAAGYVRTAEYDGSFLSDTLLKYAKHFPLSAYGFSKITENMVLSIDMYNRFLNYRIRLPYDPEDHFKFFSMKYGELCGEISANFLSYTKLLNLNNKKYLIDRYVILNVIFYYSLMRRWKDKEDPFIEKNWDEAVKLWKECFDELNKWLPKAGYGKISFKYPFDALLRISMLSFCPLEVYTRIFELNVISSYANDPLFDEGNYPPKERVSGVLDTLIKVYKKLEKLKDVTDLKIAGSVERLQILQEWVSSQK